MLVSESADVDVFIGIDRAVFTVSLLVFVFELEVQSKSKQGDQTRQTGSECTAESVEWSVGTSQ